jgi:GntR family transcriptional regulator
MTELPAIVVDMTSPVPPFEQIRAQFFTLISNGVLHRNDRLPPVRQLAADLGLAVGTTARAYRELEAAGLVRTHRGGGTRVLTSQAPPQEKRGALVHERARAYVQQARLLGATDSDLIAAVNDVLG